MTNSIKLFDASTALMNFEAFEKMSKVFAESKAFPSDMNASKFVVLMQAGNDLWLTPTEAIRSLAIINGNVSMYGTKIIERIREYWYKIQLDEKLDLVVFEKDWQKFQKYEWYCKATLSKDDETRTETYSMDDAKNAWLLTKDNRKNHPKLMLRYRAIWLGVKFFCPEVLWWVGQVEELQDHFGEQQPTRSFEKVTDFELLDWFDTNVQPTVLPTENIEQTEPKNPKTVENENQENQEKPVVEPKNQKNEIDTSELSEKDIWTMVSHKLLWEWKLVDIFMDTILVEFGSWLKKVDRGNVIRA